MNSKRFIKGKLYLNGNDRLAIANGCNGSEYEFHCGNCVELFLCDKWLHTRIEADFSTGEYYAVGLRGLKLEGVMARVQLR
ncbi:MAG: DUF5348 domain-containing protein [Clostridia bacterium]|nr:DUF5348 domain-containing protein [Clostridia bacterium]